MARHYGLGSALLTAHQTIATRVELLTVEWTVLRVLSSDEAKSDPGPAAAILKIRSTEFQQQVTELMMECAGPYALPYLSEARETVELLRVAELRDYFHDDCVDAARSRVARLDIVSQTAVVVYPIILPDRTELLVSLPSGLKRFAVPVSAATLTQEVRNLRHNLEKRTTREYLPHAQGP